jgi:peptidoglycan/LPS O-acetylase OafA/YrhL
MNIPLKIDSKTNNFDSLRLLAAFLVFFGHSILVTRNEGFFNWERGLIISAIGVNIFFIISGFLIVRSSLESKSTSLFIKKRFLRIYPGLIFLGMFTVFIIGPLTTFFSIKSYFHNPAVFDYLRSIFSLSLLDLTKNVLPGVFVSNNLPLIVNASLWTIPVEVACYSLVILMGIAGVLNKKMLFLCASAFLLFYGLVSSLGTLVAHSTINIPYADIIRLATYFILGMTIYLYREDVILSKKYFLLMLALFISAAFTQYFSLFSYFSLPLIVIFLAFKNIDFLKKLTRYGDFSYGFYLFAFPVQQSVSLFSNNKLPFALHVIISFVLTLAFAILSWNFIEKPFLKLKNVPLLSGIKKILF